VVATCRCTRRCSSSRQSGFRLHACEGRGINRVWCWRFGGDRRGSAQSPTQATSARRLSGPCQMRASGAQVSLHYGGGGRHLRYVAGCILACICRLHRSAYLKAAYAKRVVTASERRRRSRRTPAQRRCFNHRRIGAASRPRTGLVAELCALGGHLRIPADLRCMGRSRAGGRPPPAPHTKETN
jgi:hypothetical protein